MIFQRVLIEVIACFTVSMLVCLLVASLFHPPTRD